MDSDTARELSTLADTLLPGDDRFPSASSVGVHGLLVERLVKLCGRDGPAQVIAGLEQAGGPLAETDPGQRHAIVARFEVSDPELFANLRMAAYLSYYQNPIVVEAVRALGRSYNDAPQPDGYAMAPFDPTDTWQGPTHGRGHYAGTRAVKPVDLSNLPSDLTAPEDWGANDG